jgi:hypothetical protein
MLFVQGDAPDTSAHKAISDVQYALSDAGIHIKAITVESTSLLSLDPADATYPQNINPNDKGGVK